MDYSRYSNGPITSSWGLEEGYGFTECGKITYSADTEKLTFEKYDIPLKHRDGTVYLWALSVLGSVNLEVQYVGSTKSDFVYRCNTWQGQINEQVKKRKAAKDRGETDDAIEALFKTTTAQRMRKLLLQTLSDTQEISIWARVSETTNLFGKTHSLFKAEEDALIDILKPHWNGYKDHLFAEPKKKENKKA